MPRNEVKTKHTINKFDLSMEYYMERIINSIKKIFNNTKNDILQKKILELIQKISEIETYRDNMEIYPGWQTQEKFYEYKNALMDARTYHVDCFISQAERYKVSDKDKKELIKLSDWLFAAQKRVDVYFNNVSNNLKMSDAEKDTVENTNKYIKEEEAIRFEKTCNNIFNLSEALAATNKSWLTKQSKQFKNFRSAVKDLIEALDEGVNKDNAEKIVNLIENVKDKKAEYDVHCVKHHHVNKVRNSRLALVGEVMKQIDKLEKLNNDIKNAHENMDYLELYQPGV